MDKLLRVINDPVQVETAEAEEQSDSLFSRAEI